MNRRKERVFSITYGVSVAFFVTPGMHFRFLCHTYSNKSGGRRRGWRFAGCFLFFPVECPVRGVWGRGGVSAAMGGERASWGHPGAFLGAFMKAAFIGAPLRACARIVSGGGGGVSHSGRRESSGGAVSGRFFRRGGKYIVPASRAKSPHILYPKREIMRAMWQARATASA